MSSANERSDQFDRFDRFGQRNRSARVRSGPFVLVAAIALAGLAGCTSGTSSAHASSAHAPTADAPQRNAMGEAQRWCGDEEWLMPAAGLYVSAYGKARHPIEHRTIDADLASGGALRARYQRLAGRKPMPAHLGLSELREFLVALADADTAGIDPMRYARHIVATCES